MLYEVITMGLFPIGESIAFQLTSMKNNLLIYLFAFLIGFSTTMAEPSLLAIAIKTAWFWSERGGVR